MWPHPGESNPANTKLEGRADHHSCQVASGVSPAWYFMAIGKILKLTHVVDSKQKPLALDSDWSVELRVQTIKNS
jgi:hypothetical protein